MGIRNFIYPLIMDSILNNFKGVAFEQLNIAELGNQDIAVDGIKYNVAKDYFKSLGFKHDSFDFNGQDDAIIKDMSILVENDMYNNKYDIITNIGFTEHVSNSQYICFKNIHNFCKLNGIIIHHLPADYCVPLHGRFQYAPTFFEQLAKKNNYEMIKPPYTVNWSHRQQGERNINNYYVNNRDLICCAFKKNNENEFITEEQFNTIPIVDNGKDQSSHIVNFKIYEVR